MRACAKSGVLVVEATGRFSLSEARKTFLEVLEEVSRIQVYKVLFDGRSLLGAPALIERFYYGEFAARAVTQAVLQGATIAPTFAYVLVVPMLDPGRFGENVMVNRGMVARVFEGVEEAHDWLCTRSPALPAHPQ